MNAPLRRVGVVVMLLFALLFINLNFVQAYKADDYRTSDYNGRVQTSEYERKRGNIELARGIVVAESKETTDELKYLRTYPRGAEYAHIIGYKPVNLAALAVEKLENDYLSGNADSQAADRLVAMFTGNRPPGGNVLLSLSPAAQDAAYKELTHNTLGVSKGAVVVLDPATGALLAAVSTPSYDPNPLASHDTSAAEDAYNKLNADPGKPLLNRAFSEVFPPGSTFKVIVSAAALNAGLQPSTVITGGPEYQPPDTTHVIRNAQGVDCPTQLTLKQALTVSCNTAFSRLGVEQVGADKVKAMAQAFGFEDAPHFDLDDKNVMNTTASHTGSMLGPDGQVDRPVLAQSCIGQSDVRMTPLQGAMVAAAVANGGTEMRPYLVDRLLGADRTTINYTAQPKSLRQPLSPQLAAQLQDMMISVVQNGTGRKAQISGFQVGGKTGTAENGESQGDHGWFIGFAMKDGKPIVAVAVLLEGAGKGGSGEATRIAGQVMKAVIAERGLR